MSLPPWEGMARISRDCLVVFPGRRPGHHLRKALARKVGGSFVPPHILSIDELIQEIYEGRHAEPRPDLESVDAVAVLYETHRSLPHPLGGASFLSPDGFFSIGARIFSDLEELRIEGVEARAVGEVQPLIEESIPAPIPGQPADPAALLQGFLPPHRSAGILHAFFPVLGGVLFDR